MRYNTQVVLAYFKQERLPYCVPEFTFCEGRKFRWDFAFPDFRLAIEVQGGLFSGGRHVRGAALLQEQEKRNIGAELGWRILYVTPQELCMMDTVNMVKKCVAFRLS